MQGADTTYSMWFMIKNNQDAVGWYNLLYVIYG
jgi:hypothetical protein